MPTLPVPADRGVAVVAASGCRAGFLVEHRPERRARLIDVARDGLKQREREARLDVGVFAAHLGGEKFARLRGEFVVGEQG